MKDINEKINYYKQIRDLFMQKKQDSKASASFYDQLVICSPIYSLKRDSQYINTICYLFCGKIADHKVKRLELQKEKYRR